MPEFVGDIYDLACRRPEHLRMMTWANLEGLALTRRPRRLGIRPGPRHSAHRGRPGAGHVDAIWQPMDLLVLLFGVGLGVGAVAAPDAVTTDPRGQRGATRGGRGGRGRIVLPPHEIWVRRQGFEPRTR